MTPAALRSWRLTRAQPEGAATQPTAAKLLGVPVQTYRNWEQGIRRIPPTVERIIELLTPRSEQ